MTTSTDKECRATRERSVITYHRAQGRRLSLRALVEPSSTIICRSIFLRCASSSIPALPMSASTSIVADHRMSGPPSDVASLTAKLTAIQETVARKNRELDSLQSSHQRQSQHLRQLFADHLLRLHMRGYKQKKLLMNLSLSAWRCRTRWTAKRDGRRQRRRRWCRTHPNPHQRPHCANWVR